MISIFTFIKNVVNYILQQNDDFIFSLDKNW